MKVGSCSNHIIESESKGELPFKTLPKKAAAAYKFNDISLNLLSVGNVCNEDCVGVFKKKEMFVSKEEDIVITLKKEPLLKGTRNGANNLWKIPIPPVDKEVQRKNQLKTIEGNGIALSAYNQKTAEDLATFLHAYAGYPVIKTWIKYI